nr:immunoglobulin heavy chain junction region [Macaca mulatta]
CAREMVVSATSSTNWNDHSW